MIGRTMGATRTAVILCCILLMMPFANARSIEPSEWDGWAVVEGGYSILVEEYTATWCPRCADIDPDLSMVAEEHGKRIAMVSYHPRRNRCVWSRSCATPFTEARKST